MKWCPKKESNFHNPIMHSTLRKRGHYWDKIIFYDYESIANLLHLKVGNDRA